MTETPPDVVVIVLSTLPAEVDAEEFGRTLVTEGLAACVSAVPGIKSVFRWQGELTAAGETLLIVKTHARRAPDLTRRMQALHPYEVPEILVIPVAAGLNRYLEWVRTETEAPTEES